MDPMITYGEHESKRKEAIITFVNVKSRNSSAEVRGITTNPMH